MEAGFPGSRPVAVVKSGAPMVPALTSAVSPDDAPLARPVTGARREGRHAGVLFHPVIDFLCLGGASLIVLPLMALGMSSEWKPSVAITALVLTNFVNHPHFANSYQIFYRQFRRKAFGHDYPPLLRARYLGAGVGVPAAIALFFAVCLVSEDAWMLGLGANAMAFLVGWHYVKQGYGMIILDSVLKRSFFEDHEKKALLWNAYACWITSWIVANTTIVDRNIWGLPYYAIPIPAPVYYVAVGVATVSTMCALWTLTRKALTRNARPPFNGIMAYVVTLYVWLVFVRALGPVALLIVPAFHSLQYLVVVWRYELNWERGRTSATSSGTDPAARPRRGLAKFIATSVLVGFIGFWLLPILLDSLHLLDRATFGKTAFLFMFWIFINVHHYFLDSVIWRRENPDTRKYLFV